jgi:hypothetical protein
VSGRSRYRLRALPVVLALAIASGLFAQPRSAVRDSLPLARHTVYAEGWGVSGVASLNVERALLARDRWRLGARVGLGTIQLRDFSRRFNPDLVVPVGGYASYGGKFAAELGAGVAFTSVVHPDPDTFSPVRIQRLHGWLGAGVRTGGTRRGLFARASVNLLFEFGRVSRTAGLGLGYRF